MKYKSITLVTGKRGGESLHYNIYDGSSVKKISPRQFKHLDLPFFMRDYDIEKVKPALWQSSKPSSLGRQVEYYGYKRDKDIEKMREFELHHNIVTLENVSKNPMQRVKKSLYDFSIEILA